MIKLKNLWKIALAAMTMSAMLVACDTTSTNKEEEKEVAPDYATMTFDSNVYVSGIDGQWAADTDFGNSYGMTKDGNVYTYEFTYDSTSDEDVIPYGFKFNTAKGWMEQYVNAEFGYEETTTRIEFGKEYAVAKQGKIGLEWDYDGKKINDTSTKFYLANKLVSGEKYTLTLNLDTMKVKFDGKAGESNKELTLADVKCIAGTVSTWNEPHPEMTDGKTYTFTATEAGEARFKFTTGTWAFQAGSADGDTTGKAEDPAHAYTAADMGKEIEITGASNATAFIFPVEAGKEYTITLDVTQKFMKFEEKK